jgi:FKBP-type peptidyl-prolyl cis-trans isomerase FkpA
MNKNKYIVIGGALTFVILLASVGFFVWQNQAQASSQIEEVATDDVLMGAPQGFTNPGDVSSVPLGSMAQSQPSTSGLSVASNGGSASNLGQLTPNSGGSSSQGNSPSSSGSGAKASPFNPATFGQYEKYKDGEAALFGEVQIGNGAEVRENKKAAVFYKGWLTNGQMFDQSRTDEKGKLQPFIFTPGTNQVIAGWEQAITGMKVGGTRVFIVPPSVGYGAQGQGSIPPNSVLIFEVQLVAVEE